MRLSKSAVERLVGGVARGDAGAAGRDDDARAPARDLVADGRGDVVRLVAHDMAADDRVSGVLEQVGDRPAAGLRLERPRVAHREHEARRRWCVGACRADMVSHLTSARL